MEEITNEYVNQLVRARARCARAARLHRGSAAVRSPAALDDRARRRGEERAATEDELAAAFAEVGAQHGLSPHVYSERCEIARIMARGRHPAYHRHRCGG
jgi:hypothetical protein